MEKQFDVYIPKYKIIDGLVYGKDKCTRKELENAFSVGGHAYSIKFEYPADRTINLKHLTTN